MALSYEDAKALYETLSQQAKADRDPDVQEFWTGLRQEAPKYAAIRAQWATMSPQEQAEADKGRSVIHDGFMARLDPLCRALGIDTATLLPDRKAKGDFACYITLFLGLENR